MNYQITGRVKGGQNMYTTNKKYKVAKEYPTGPKQGADLTLVGTDIHDEPAFYRTAGDDEG